MRASNGQTDGQRDRRMDDTIRNTAAIADMDQLQMYVIVIQLYM